MWGSASVVGWLGSKLGLKEKVLADDTRMSQMLLAQAQRGTCGNGDSYASNFGSLGFSGFCATAELSQDLSR